VISECGQDFSTNSQCIDQELHCNLLYYNNFKKLQLKLVVLSPVIMISVKLINKNICKSELLIIWLLFYFIIAVCTNSTLLGWAALYWESWLLASHWSNYVYFVVVVCITQKASVKAFWVFADQEISHFVVPYHSILHPCVIVCGINKARMVNNSASNSLIHQEILNNYRFVRSSSFAFSRLYLMFWVKFLKIHT